MTPTAPDTGGLSRSAEAALHRALRDMRDGHLTVWRSPTGQDRPDRQVAGAPSDWWEVLRARGLAAPPAGAGAWTVSR